MPILSEHVVRRGHGPLGAVSFLHDMFAVFTQRPHQRWARPILLTNAMCVRTRTNRYPLPCSINLARFASRCRVQRIRGDGASRHFWRLSGADIFDCFRHPLLGTRTKFATLSLTPQSHPRRHRDSCRYSWRHTSRDRTGSPESPPRIRALPAPEQRNLRVREERRDSAGMV